MRGKSLEVSTPAAGKGASWRGPGKEAAPMADECSTPKAPRELRKKLKNGEITEAEFERQVAALRLTPADAATPDAPSSPARSLSRQFSELMDPEVKSLLSKTKLGKEKEVKEILSRNPGILKDAADMYGNTVLHLAALNGHKRIVKEVLRNSQHYDPYAVNKKGLSAADLARDFNYPELADYIREKLPGIPFAKAEAPSTEAAIDKKQGQLDEVSVELARVQAERYDSVFVSHTACTQAWHRAHTPTPTHPHTHTQRTAGAGAAAAHTRIASRHQQGRPASPFES